MTVQGDCQCASWAGQGLRNHDLSDGLHAEFRPHRFVSGVEIHVPILERHSWVAGGTSTLQGRPQSETSTNQADCTSYGFGRQQWTMTIFQRALHDDSKRPSSMTRRDRDIRGRHAKPVVFLQPTSFQGAGTINAAISPQPIMAIEGPRATLCTAIPRLSPSRSCPAAAPQGEHCASNCSSVENEGIFARSVVAV